jgi:hypothetical protein
MATKHFLYVILIIACFTSCSKNVDNTNNNAGNNSNNNSSTSAPTIRFFNVMDYGDVTVNLNTINLSNIALWFPSTYRAAVNGSNNIVVGFNGTDVVSQRVDLVNGNHYTCYIYRVGFNWRISITIDDLTLPALGSSNIRVLDFRTQAYFDYINVRVFGLGLGTLNYTNRNFLDHLSYDSYSRFNNTPSGRYNIILFNNTINLATKDSVNFVSRGIYTILLYTPAGLTAAEALNNINIDVQQNR